MKRTSRRWPLRRRSATRPCDGSLLSWIKTHGNLREIAKRLLPSSRPILPSANVHEPPTRHSLVSRDNSGPLPTKPPSLSATNAHYRLLSTVATSPMRPVLQAPGVGTSSSPNFRPSAKPGRPRSTNRRFMLPSFCRHQAAFYLRFASGPGTSSSPALGSHPHEVNRAAPANPEPWSSSSSFILVSSPPCPASGAASAVDSRAVSVNV